MSLSERLKSDTFEIAVFFLNLIYMVLGFSLVGAVVWHHQQTRLTVYPLALGLAGIGAALGVLAVYGSIVFWMKRAKLIIPYDIAACVIVVLLAGVGGACLTSDSSYLMPYLSRGWANADMQLLHQIQVDQECCGFEEPNLPFNDPAGLGHPPCSKLGCCGLSVSSCCSGWDSQEGESCPCQLTCSAVLITHMSHSVQVIGGAALVFALVKLFGTSFILVHHLQQYKRRKLELELEEQTPQETSAPYERF